MTTLRTRTCGATLTEPWMPTCGGTQHIEVPVSLSNEYYSTVATDPMSSEFGVKSDTPMKYEIKVNPSSIHMEHGCCPAEAKRQEVGEHLIDLSDGRNRKVRQQPRFPAMVWLHTNMIKNTIYDIGQRDKRLPDGAPKQQMWPLNPESRGYTEAWFREFANEVRMFHRTPKGTPTSHWEVKAGQGKKNEAWDCRIYATGAAIVHCQLFGPVSLQVGLLRMAIQDGVQSEGRWTEEEMASLRRHLQIAGAEEYSGMTPVR